MNYTVHNPHNLPRAVDPADIDACGGVIASNNHIVYVLRNEFVPDNDIDTDIASVTFPINSQPLQYKALRQALAWFVGNCSQLQCIHLQVGRKFLSDCRSMGRWRHIEHLLNRRIVYVQFTNNNPMSFSRDPLIARFREFLVRGATPTDCRYLHSRPDASRVRPYILLVVTFTEDLGRISS